MSNYEQQLQEITRAEKNLRDALYKEIEPILRPIMDFLVRLLGLFNNN